MILSFARIRKDSREILLTGISFVDNLVKNSLKLFMYLDNKFFTPSEDALITGIKAIIAEEYSRNLSKKLNNANRRRVERALAGEEIAAMGNG